MDNTNHYNMCLVYTRTPVHGRIRLLENTALPKGRQIDTS